MRNKLSIRHHEALHGKLRSAISFSSNIICIQRPLRHTPILRGVAIRRLIMLRLLWRLKLEKMQSLRLLILRKLGLNLLRIHCHAV